MLNKIPLTLLAALFCVASLYAEKVTFRVRVPATTPAADIIFIVGNQSQLGDWRPERVALTKVGDQVWEKSFIFSAGKQLEYKITRGSWQTEAVTASHTVPGNSFLSVSRDTILTIIVPEWRDVAFKSEGGITGQVRYHRGLVGEGLNYQHDLIVWLPPSYDSKLSQRYPVLYMHDGQNVFDPSTSFIGVDWRVDEVADSLIKAGSLPELIVVGISNSPDRIQEYSDTSLGRAYMKFVVAAVKPLIDSTYRTLPDCQHTAVMGSSMGGLISFYLIWRYPQVFAGAACLSTWFIHNDGVLIQEIKDAPAAPSGIRIYLDNGSVGMEGLNTQMFQDVRDLLVQKGLVLGKNLLYFYAEGADHSERAWAHRVWRPLLFLFGE